MKKLKKIELLTLALLSSIVLVSCSGDDNVDTNSSVIAQLVATSNTSGSISYFDFTDAENVKSNTIATSSSDADGVYMDPSGTEIIVGSRSNNRIEVYENSQSNLLSIEASLTLRINSNGSEFTNNREIAVSNSKIVVAQDAGDSNGNLNKLLVYERSGNQITLVNSYTVSFNLWGIHLEGNTLYAIEDNSNRLSVFENFFNNADGVISATKSAAISGITRTHGITLSTVDDVMILTDVGDAASQTDGGFVVISNFSSTLGATPDGGTISAGSLTTVYGAASLMGNPVDVAYDQVTGKIFIAERANAGGQILVYDFPTQSGDVAPSYQQSFSGVSSVYFSRN